LSPRQQAGDKERDLVTGNVEIVEEREEGRPEIIQRLGKRATQIGSSLP